MKMLSYFLWVGLFCISIAYSADTADVEAVRSRAQNSSSELGASDISVISSFWESALGQMLLSKTSLELVEVRRQLEQQKGTESLSYYATAYISVAKKSIQTAFQDSLRLDNQRQRELVQRNLMILTANLESTQLVPLATEQLGSADDVVRYWAVKSMTQPAIIQQLTSEVTQDEAVLDQILGALKSHAPKESNLEIKKMIAGFCMAFDNPAARDILLMLADERIKAYKAWKADDILPDTRFLSAVGMAAVVQKNPEVKTRLGRAFAEFFALVIQRYMMAYESQSDRESLDLLNTVIAEVDKNVVNDAMEIQTGIVNAIRTKNMTALEREYEVLFGDRMRPGQLAQKFKFDYGKDTSGKALTAPPKLGPKPANTASQN